MKRDITDTGVYAAAMKLTSVLWIGCLWLFCSIPLFSSGAASAAMYKMFFNLRKDGKCDAPAFFAAFRQSFKQGSFIWLTVMGTVLIITGAYTGAVLAGSTALKLALLTVCLALFIPLMLLNIYAYALTGCFENRLINTVKNALALGVCNRRTSLWGIIITMLPVLALFISPYYFLRLLFVWLFFYPPLAAYLISGRVESIFEELSKQNI